MALGSEGSPPNPWPGYVMRLASDPVSWAKQPNHTNEKASVSNIFFCSPSSLETRHCNTPR